MRPLRLQVTLALRYLGQREPVDPKAHEPEPGQLVLPAQGQILLGRGAQATLRLGHHTLARLHARLTLLTDEEGQAAFLVDDLGSTHGTVVAAPGQPEQLTWSLDQAPRLYPGGRLWLCGRFGFEVVVLQTPPKP